MKRVREPEPPLQRRAVQPIPGSGPRPGAQPAAGASQKLTTNDALSYLREVKNRFADRKQVYDTFLDIMKEFKAQRIDTSGVIVRVKQLFKGHRELILGFNTFLPKGYEIELARISDDEEEEPAQPKQAVEFDQAINYVNKIKNRFSSDERVYKAFLEILNMYRKGQKNINHVYSEVAVLFQNHDDLLHEFTYFLPDNSNQGAQMRQFLRNPNMPQPRHGPMKPQGRGGPPGSFGPGMMGNQPMQQAMPGSPHHDHSRFMHKRKAARRAEEGFLRMEGGEDAYGPARGVARGGMGKEMQFLEKFKNRLRSKEQYGDFLKCLNMYSNDIITRHELVHLVADILGRTPELMQLFQQFMSSCETTDMGDQMAGTRGGGVAMNHRDLLKARLQKDKYMTKPLSEIVATETQRITPSYVKMPDGYPKLTQSGRTPLGDEVLNDQYVNVITGSEDYSFKLMRKNQYEEALFRCEDDRYEFDMVCEQNLSTIRVFRPLSEKIQSMSPEERAAFNWREDVRGVNAVHLGHIQRLYAESGLQMVDLLMKNPAVAIPVILARLEAKEGEWRKVKEEMVPTWKKIYELNYPRSLDHRSFYFKQAEKKCMMTKAMVAEIKESADRRKADEQHLRVLSMAFRNSIPAQAAATPDLVFTYADRTVFEDVYLALRSAIEHQLHAGHKEQVLMLYLQTIETFLGLPERTDEISKLREQAEDDDGDKDADVDMNDMKSDSSDQDEGKANGDDAMGPDSGKTTPGLEGTPEPGAEDKPQASGEQTGAEGEDRGYDEDRAELRVASSSEPHSRGDKDGASTYARCKPIMPWSGAAPGPHHHILASGKRLLFANENMYVFFRYHRYLYERLCSARKFSLELATKKATAPVRGGGPLGVPSAVDADGNRTPQPEVSEAAIKEDADRVHATFLACLRQMLSTGSDVGAFEDQVRNLLGTNSYELFTLDKLLSRLVKHLQLMVSDDHTLKLWEMYGYEQSRGTPVSTSMYHVNCHTVLDDTCYRIEFSDSDYALRFQQNDAERSDAYLAPEGALPAYIVNYINNTSVPPATLPQSSGDSSHRAALFLRRNLPATTRQAGDDALVAALDEVLVNNGLESKIGCTTCKVSYVLDTEDMMVRKHRAPSETGEAMRDKRCTRFNTWLTQMHEAAEKRKAEEEEEAAAARTLAAAVTQG